MESSESCFSRAKADRDAAAISLLPREREVLERSAQNWEDMGNRALHVEKHRVADEARRAEEKAAKEAPPPPPPPTSRSFRERLGWLRATA